MWQIGSNISERLMRSKEQERAHNFKNARTDKGRYSRAKADAKKRSVPFKLTREEFLVLRSKPCTYCGGPLPEAAAGLDQKVAGLGYTKENAVPCCTVCNRAKAHVFTYEEMLQIGEMIRTIRTKRTLR